MTSLPTAVETERFRRALVHCLGLQFDDAKLSFLAEVLRRRLDVAGSSTAGYLARLEDDCPKEEVAALAQELTVPETYFFRHLEQYRALAEIVLPDRLQARSAARSLHILSAGCASGEEAYSLAAIARESVADPTWEVSVLGVDVNPQMVHRARQGRFSAWALRETSPDQRQKWFRPDGRDFLIDGSLRASVRFAEANLVLPDPQLWAREAYDIVFFRNVLMYFTVEQARRVIEQVVTALRPGGYLFLGHAETIRGLSDEFHLHHTHQTFYYQRKDRLNRAPREMAADVSLARPAPAVLAAVDGTETWIDAIRRASERIERLSVPEQAVWQPASPPPAGGRRPWDLAIARDLLREERFGEALETMQRLPPESGRDVDVLLLQAALLTQQGQRAEAEEVCHRLLAVDELNAGAHYLLALCQEGEGNGSRAVDHDQIAVYLDPGFAMPHLHLGLLARRLGDLTTAQHELGQALTLLRQEDSSRILLFGGGFGREALMALCRTELVRCGGKP